MKVALELQPCCGKRSGIGTYAYELACHLKDRDGVEFCGNLFNFWGRNDNSASLLGISMPICENKLVPYGVYRRLWHAIPISHQTFFSEDAKLNVFFNFIVPPHLKGKVMTTVHDLTYLRYPQTMDARNLHRITKDIQYSVERSDRVLTISEFAKREIVELLHVSPEQISVIYAAPSSLPTAADFSTTAVKYGLKRPYILYVGTIEPRKNLIRLVQAFDRLKREEKIPHQLILAGGNGWNNEDIYSAARMSVYSAEIIFTGYISSEEKTALYQNADVFVFPSLYEGFGIPPLEAMSQGCPVVCANTASLPEVVGDAAILVNPLDDKSISDGIFRVLADACCRSSLIDKGSQQVKKFTWQNSADRLLSVCKEVLSCP